uniref:Uncharacterized protein n=1 Tax=Lotharella globosa TaxID=91324 RepID=A0A6V3JMU8_9EUKA
MLAGATGLNGFADFCIACWVFRNILIPAGFINEESLANSIEVLIDERQDQEDIFAYKKWNEGPHYVFDGYAPATTSDGRALRYKYSNKTNHQREDRVDFVRHCKVEYCLPALGWLAVASNFKALFQADLIHEQYPWCAMALTGGTFFAIWAVLYLAKLVLYPHKVWKDLDHKMSRYSFSLISIAFLLGSFLAQREQDDRYISLPLFWIGAIANLVITVWLLARKVLHPVGSGEINPMMLFPLLGNLLAVIVLQKWFNWKGLMDFAFFLFGPSFLLWNLLAAGILYQVIQSPTLDPGLRISLFSYVAGPALSAQGYLALTNEMDIVFFTLFFFSVFTEIFLAFVFFMNYYKNKFNEGKWVAVFCLAAATFPLITFHNSRDTEFTYIWLMAHLATVFGLALAMTSHTISNIIYGKWFRTWPRGVSAMAFVTLTHDAFRTAGNALNELAEKIQDNHFQCDEDREETKSKFVEILDAYLVTLKVHSEYEERYINTAVDMCFPGREKIAEEQHREIERDELELHKLLHIIALNMGMPARQTTGSTDPPDAKMIGSPGKDPWEAPISPQGHSRSRQLQKQRQMSGTKEMQDLVVAFESRGTGVQKGRHRESSVVSKLRYNQSRRLSRSQNSRHSATDDNQYLHKSTHRLEQLQLETAQTLEKMGVAAPKLADLEMQEITKGEKEEFEAEQPDETKTTKTGATNKSDETETGPSLHQRKYSEIKPLAAQLGVNLVLGAKKEDLVEAILEKKAEEKAKNEKAQREKEQREKAQREKAQKEQAEKERAEKEAQRLAAEKEKNDKLKAEEKKGKSLNVYEDSNRKHQRRRSDQVSTEMAWKLILKKVPSFTLGMHDHLRHEEDHISNRLKKCLSAKDQRSVGRKCLKVGTAEQWAKIVPFLINHQDYHYRRLAVLTSFRKAFPERMQVYGAWLYRGISPILFQRLRVDFPEIAPRYTEGYRRLW